jgi:hypothetical protein
LHSTGEAGVVSGLFIGDYPVESVEKLLAAVRLGEGGRSGRSVDLVAAFPEPAIQPSLRSLHELGPGLPGGIALGGVAANAVEDRLRVAAGLDRCPIAGLSVLAAVGAEAAGIGRPDFPEAEIGLFEGGGSLGGWVWINLYGNKVR